MVQICSQMTFSSIVPRDRFLLVTPVILVITFYTFGLSTLSHRITKLKRISTVMKALWGYNSLHLLLKPLLWSQLCLARPIILGHLDFYGFFTILFYLTEQVLGNTPRAC